jgi:hypothetical protein
MLHGAASDGHGILHVIQTTLRGFENGFVLFSAQLTHDQGDPRFSGPADV